MLWFRSIVLTIHCCLSPVYFPWTWCSLLLSQASGVGNTFSVSSGLLQKMSWLPLLPCSRLWAWVAGGREHPQRQFSLHTHLGVAELRGSSQGTLSRTCRHTFPGSLWLQPLCPEPHRDQGPSAVRQVERPHTGSVVSTRAKCSASLFLAPWQPAFLDTRWGRKRGCNF